MQRPDIAVLHAELSPLVPFAMAGVPAVEDSVAATGASNWVRMAKRWDNESGLGEFSTISFGRALGAGRTINERRHPPYRLIRHTAPTTHGDSGGALVNQRGELIGINSTVHAPWWLSWLPYIGVRVNLLMGGVGSSSQAVRPDFDWLTDLIATDRQRQTASRQRSSGCRRFISRSPAKILHLRLLFDVSSTTPTAPPAPSLLRRLTLPKFLLKEAHRAVQRPGPHSHGLATSILQDTNEAFLRILAVERGVNVNLNEWFSKVLGDVATRIPSVTQYRAGLVHLNNARVMFKRQGLSTLQRNDVIVFAGNVDAFLTHVCKAELIIDFVTASLADAIGHRRTQNWIAKAEHAFAAGDFDEPPAARFRRHGHLPRTQQRPQSRIRPLVAALALLRYPLDLPAHSPRFPRRSCRPHRMAVCN